MNVYQSHMSHQTSLTMKQQNLILKHPNHHKDHNVQFDAYEYADSTNVGIIESADTATLAEHCT